MDSATSMIFNQTIHLLVKNLMLTFIGRIIKINSPPKTKFRNSLFFILIIPVNSVKYC